MVAVRKLLVEIEIDEIIEIATKLCSTVGIPIHYEDPLTNTGEDTTTPREFMWKPKVIFHSVSFSRSFQKS